MGDPGLCSTQLVKDWDLSLDTSVCPQARGSNPMETVYSHELAETQDIQETGSRGKQICFPNCYTMLRLTSLEGSAAPPGHKGKEMVVTVVGTTNWTIHSCSL